MKLRDLDKIIPAPDLLELLRAAGYDHSCVHHACYKSFSYLTFTKLLVEYLRPEGGAWVPCAERMPEPTSHHQIGSYSEYVLVWVPWMESKIECLRAAFRPQGEFVGWVGLHHTDQPTHWMPRPTPQPVCSSEKER